MTRRPLFSTYSQGENRVTGSILAVFERLDLRTLQTILAEAVEDPSLELLAFRLQPTLAAGTVPDAEIGAAFRFLFEVKTAFDAVSLKQLEGHLLHLSGGTNVDERLFVITSDAAVSAAVALLEDRDDRVTWFNFSRLNAAIQVALAAEEVRDDERLLLRELQLLLADEGLLGRQDTVIVAARHAYAFYATYGAYVCQRGRSFRRELTHLGFYRKRQIEPEIPQILHIEDDVEFTSAEIVRRRAQGGDANDQIATLIEESLAHGSRKDGAIHKVFVLSGPTDTETVKLANPLSHTAEGAGSAFTMGQRYVYLEDLETAKSTTDLR